MNIRLDEMVSTAADMAADAAHIKYNVPGGAGCKQGYYGSEILVRLTVSEQQPANWCPDPGGI